MRYTTYVYVDGLNLYYRSLKRAPQFKWLDPRALCEYLLKKNDIRQVRYYTAVLSEPLDPGAYARQARYLAALRTIPGFSLHYGRFLVMDKPMRLAPAYDKFLRGTVLVCKPEEKGSDVSLGAHLVRDGFNGSYQAAAVLTNDTDLAEPIRIVVEELGLPVGLISPVNNPAGELKEVASFIRRISRSALAQSQFPEVIPGKPKLVRPHEWTAPTR